MGTPRLNSYFGDSSANVVMCNVDCDADDDELAECRHSVWEVKNAYCGQGNSVGVTCANGRSLILVFYTL